MLRSFTTMPSIDRNDPDPAVYLRVRVERTIVRCAIRALVAEGYAVAVQGHAPTRHVEMVMEDIMKGDEEDLLLVYPADVTDTASSEPLGKVSLVYGSQGWDVMRDYTANLGHIMERVEAYARAMKSWC